MKTRIITLGIFLVLALLLSACGKKTTPQPLPTAAPVTVATEAPQPAADTPAVVLTEAPTEAATPVPEPTAVVITHVVTPGEPSFTFSQKVSDCDTGERVHLGATTLVGQGCDNWNKANLERPTDQFNGTYVPALDIVSSSMASSNSFLYGGGVLYKDAAGAIPAELISGFEIDTDIDSRGEYLILATNITSGAWTTDGVQVWQDVNGDVGGDKPHNPDGKPGDGYETLVFDSGIGADPDLAWVRLSPVDPSAIEFAFKPDLLPANNVFAWWAWTSIGALDPGKMEIVDLMQDTSTWQIDNTCAWIFNGKPTNLLVNICNFITPTPTLLPTQPHSSGGTGPTGCITTPTLCMSPKVWSPCACGCVLKVCFAGQYWTESACGCVSCSVPQPCPYNQYWDVGDCKCKWIN